MDAHRKIVEAEAKSAKYLSDYREFMADNKMARAEKALEKSQHFLDRANHLREKYQKQDPARVREVML